MSDPDRLAAIVANFARARVLVLGDVMLDVTVWGVAERMSPEAPVPVLLAERETMTLGGAGNVARSVAALGAQTVLIAAAGADESGQSLALLLEQDGRIEPRLVIEETLVTTRKTRFLAGRQQLLRVDREAPVPAGGALAERLLLAYGQAVEETDIVILADYAKGTLADAVLAPALARAGALGKPVVVEPKGPDFGRYRGASVLSLGRSEAVAAMRVPLQDAEATAAAARELMASWEITAVLVTRGTEGMTLVDGGNRAVHMPARAREVQDVTGAGDTAAAVLATALAAGGTIEEAAHLANLAAGIAASRLGTAEVSPPELLEAIQAEGRRSPAARRPA